LWNEPHQEEDDDKGRDHRGCIDQGDAFRGFLGRLADPLADGCYAIRNAFAGFGHAGVETAGSSRRQDLFPSALAGGWHFPRSALMERCVGLSLQNDADGVMLLAS
jgi:hypothetical protein